MAELVTDTLSVQAEDGTEIVRPTSLRMEGGELVALVGPNGAGKSSLVRALAGVARYRGSAMLDGAEIAAMPPQTRARQIAWLPQSLPPAWPVLVRDAVALGRYAHGAAPGQLAPEDARAVDAALAACNVEALTARRITSLSGGELARVHLARALAADANLLLADEPAAALDLAHRWALMALLRGEAGRGRAVLVVVHDLSLAARWADRVLVMDQARIVADGAPAAVLTRSLLARVFGVHAEIGHHNGILEIVVRGPVIGTAAAAAD